MNHEDEKKQKNVTYELFYQYVRENKSVTFQYFFFILLTYILESIVLPRYSAQLFEIFQDKKHFKKVIQVFVYITIIWVVIQGCMAYTGHIEAKIYPDIWIYLRNYIMKNLYYRYETEYQELELGKINNQLSIIPGNFTEFVSVVFEYILPRIIIIICIIIYFFFIHIQIGFVSLFLFGGLVLFYQMKMRTCVELSHQRHKMFQDISEDVQDKLSNLATIYTSGQVDNEIEWNKKTHHKFGEVYYQQNVCTNTIKTYAYVFNTVYFIVLISFTLYLYKKGEITSTSFIALFMTTLYLFTYLVRLTTNFPSLVLKMGIIEKTDDFLKDIQKETKKEVTNQFDIKNGMIVFSHIDFGYDKDTKILNDVTLHIYPNTKTCILGSSGSGKSTLCKLLCKFYIPNAGIIYIDNKDIKQMDTNHLRKQISYVNQNTRLFNKTIYENIQYGNPNLTKSQINQKIDELGIKDIFKNIHYNYNTNVGVNGSKLSGGQRQMVCILRELLNDSPKILILDEPTASIDEKNKQYIYQLIQNIGNEKTIIVITHDMNHLEMYDNVYLLKNGKIQNYNGKL